MSIFLYYNSRATRNTASIKYSGKILIMNSLPYVKEPAPTGITYEKLYNAYTEKNGKADFKGAILVIILGIIIFSGTYMLALYSQQTAKKAALSAEKNDYQKLSAKTGAKPQTKSGSAQGSEDINKEASGTTVYFGAVFLIIAGFIFLGVSAFKSITAPSEVRELEPYYIHAYRTKAVILNNSHYTPQENDTSLLTAHYLYFDHYGNHHFFSIKSVSFSAGNKDTVFYNMENPNIGVHIGNRPWEDTVAENRFFTATTFPPFAKATEMIEKYRSSLHDDNILSL